MLYIGRYLFNSNYEYPECFQSLEGEKQKLLFRWIMFARSETGPSSTEGLVVVMILGPKYPRGNTEVLFAMLATFCPAKLVPHPECGHSVIAQDSTFRFHAIKPGGIVHLTEIWICRIFLGALKRDR